MAGRNVSHSSVFMEQLLYKIEAKRMLVIKCTVGAFGREKKEQESLDTLTARYNKMIEPSKIAKIGKKAGELVPEKIKTWGKALGISIASR